MTSFEKYFERNSGEWHWNSQFYVHNWVLFLKSKMKFALKCRFISVLILQKILGRFLVLTTVDYKKDEKCVIHVFQLKKFGICFYRSEKVFEYEATINEILITGSESYFPRLEIKFPFKPLRGRILDNATEAEYQMPFLGLTISCRTQLNSEVQSLEAVNDFMRGAFTLQIDSVKILQNRLQL